MIFSKQQAERLEFAAGLAHRVRALRIAGGHGSIAAFAKFIDLPLSTLRRCEAGRLIASHRIHDLMMAVAEATGASIDWIVGGLPGVPWRRPRDVATSKVATFPYWRVRLPGR
jgi:hypothetical protein